MTEERYPIPACRHQVEVVERRSRFICVVDCTPSVEAAREHIDAVKREYPDATHHVYAFAVGYGGSVTHGMSDAGEPSGTAGRPTLAVVQGSGLGDVCVVTARYFGGTKLGTGGLVRAYTQAAQQALGEVPRTQRVDRRTVTIECPYPLYERVNRLVLEHGGVIEAETFTDAVTIRAALATDRLSAFESSLAEATSGRVSLVVNEH